MSKTMTTADELAQAQARIAELEKMLSAQTQKRETPILRAARVIIEAGEKIDIADLAKRTKMSERSAKRCFDAYQGVTEALKEANLLTTENTGDAAATA